MAWLVAQDCQAEWEYSEGAQDLTDVQFAGCLPHYDSDLEVNVTSNVNGFVGFFGGNPKIDQLILPSQENNWTLYALIVEPANGSHHVVVTINKRQYNGGGGYYPPYHRVFHATVAREDSTLHFILYKVAVFNLRKMAATANPDSNASFSTKYLAVKNSNPNGFEFFYFIFRFLSVSRKISLFI